MSVITDFAKEIILPSVLLSVAIAGVVFVYREGHWILSLVVLLVITIGLHLFSNWWFHRVESNGGDEA